jgi:hypothetical protein
MDLLRLSSRAPDPLAPPRAPGRVVDPGDDGRGERDGVRVELTAPAWLVLAESYNRGWQAECDGRDLGEPRPIDGYANGWRAPVDCRDVEFRFGPQRVLTAGFALSGVACLLLLAFLLLRAPGALAPSRGDREAPAPLAAAPTRSWRLPLRHALAIGLVAGLAGGFLFALRAGVVIGPAVALLLWRGAGVAPLALAAGLLAGIVLPAIYLTFPPEDQGGFNSNYASDLLGAHWVAVAVWVLLAVALVRSLPRLRASWRGSRSST